MSIKNLIAVTLLLLQTLWVGALASTNAQPLLMEGKQALFQRVLAMPGSQLHAQIEQPGREVTPFTAYYVYARKNVQGVEWLQVGTGRHGQIEGWISAGDSIEWNQGLTVAFREPKDHDRALLFRDPESLQSVTAEPERYRALYQAASKGEISPDSPVVAIQPPGKLDIREDFYLVPIREHRDIYLGSEQVRMLKVSSVPLENENPEQDEQPAGDSAPASRKAYRAGLVFVIDATLSMDPYIDRTRQAVMKIFDNLGDADLLGNVNFGLVAFRDATRPAPGLGYLARSYVNLEQGSNPETFVKQVEALKAARVSSQDFIEDAYAGVKKAIDEMDWEGHAARYLVLITDAGPRSGSDPLSSTGLDAEALAQMARDKGIAIFVMHLLTPATMADHARAAETYRELSRFPGIGNLYYAVPTGDVKEFGHVLDTLAGQITMQVQMAGASLPQPEVKKSANTQLAELQGKIERLGYALRMQYLQETEGGKPPRLFDAWLLDRDIRNPEKHTLDVQVLLTRDQLSELHGILRQVLFTAEEGLLSPSNFLNELKSLAATLARDPEQLGETTATTAGEGNSLADLGFMREYIEDLPYTGEVMQLSLEEWETWPARAQIDFLHRLEEKIDYYRALHDHTDLWVSLHGGPVDGDSVLPVPLEMLP